MGMMPDSHHRWSSLLPSDGRAWAWTGFNLVAYTTLAAAARIWPLGEMHIRAPWLTFYPAVMLASILGGLVAGLGVGLASIMVVWLCPIPLFGAPVLLTRADWLGALVFAGNTGLVAWLAAVARQRGRDLQERNLALAKALDVAHDAALAKDRFLARMSHELRTPLHAILGFANLLGTTNNLTAGQRSSLQHIQQGGEHLLDLINEVLEISRNSRNGIEVLTEPCDVRLLMDRTVTLLQHRAQTKGLDLALELEGSVPQCLITDPRRLRQIVINLISNALNATERGQVRVLVSPATIDGQAQLRIVVRDTGPGIPEGERERIFEPFVQLSPSGTGLGLGLAIVRQIVTALHGHIQVHAASGGGAEFEVLLPAIATAAPAQTSPPRSSSITILKPPLRIHYAEDTDANYHLVSSILGIPGVMLTRSVDGPSALADLQQQTPDLLLLDLRLPGLDGVSILRRLIAAGPLCYPVVILTASVFPNQIAEVLAIGATAVLQKPFGPQDLIDLLHHVLPDRVQVTTHHGIPDASSPGKSLGPGDLLHLPADQAVRLKKAVLTQDGNQIRELGLALQDPRIVHHAQELEYSAILRALQPPLANP